MNGEFLIKTAIVDNEIIHYRLYYKNNRNFYMRLGSNNLINVIVPIFATQDQVNNFVNANIKKLHQYSKTVQKQTIFNLDKNILCIFNADYSLKCLTGAKKQKYELINNTFYVHLKSFNQQLTVIKKIYNDVCSNLLIKRTHELLHKFEINANNVNTKWMSSKWGYCNYREKSITLALQLGAYSWDVIDYVIIHEIMHLIQPNHSAKFWKLVSSQLPNYKILRNKLKNFNDSM